MSSKYYEDDTDLVSKTKLKQEAHDSQSLGQELTTLKPKILVQLPLPETVVNAVNEYNRLPNSHGARRRQLQFLGKLMRHCDADEIRAAIDRLLDPTRKIKPKTSQATEYCQKILNGGDEAINIVVAEFPQLERQKLHQLYREHERAPEAKRPKLVSKMKTYLIQIVG